MGLHVSQNAAPVSQNATSVGQNAVPVDPSSPCGPRMQCGRRMQPLWVQTAAPVGQSAATSIIIPHQNSLQMVPGIVPLIQQIHRK